MAKTHKQVSGRLTKCKVFELISENDNTLERTADITSAVGDLVMANGEDAVEVPTDNTDIRPIIGIIIEKVNSTTAKILLLGDIDGFVGLTPDRKVFLSPTGGVTSTPPTTGYLQCLGVANGSTGIYFRPSTERVLRV